MNEKMKVSKKLATVGIGAGAAYVVTQAVKFVCPAGGTVFEKMGTLIGGAVLSAMMADKASEYAEKKLEQAIENFEESVMIEAIPEEEAEGA